MKTLIFFATYNEVGNVALMLERIALAAPDADILVVDDSSKDGTLTVLDSLRRDNLTVLVRPGKLGLGTAHLLAWKYALHHGYDILVTMDGDHSHDPADIPRLVAQLNGDKGSDKDIDIVIGSRYAPGGRCDYSGYRLWVSRLANWGARWLLGIRLSEFTTSFRAFRVPRLNSIDFNTLRVGGYSFFLTVIVQAHLHRLRIAEVPIHFHERNAGTSKIPPLEIFRGMANLLRLATICHFRRPALDPVNQVRVCVKCSSPFAAMSAPLESKTGDRNGGSTTVCLFCGDSR
jgi:dolichol-phosphate mannosyltransferase